MLVVNFIDDRTANESESFIKIPRNGCEACAISAVAQELRIFAYSRKSAKQISRMRFRHTTTPRVQPSLKVGVIFSFIKSSSAPKRGRRRVRKMLLWNFMAIGRLVLYCAGCQLNWMEHASLSFIRIGWVNEMHTHAEDLSLPTQACGYTTV